MSLLLISSYHVSIMITNEELFIIFPNIRSLKHIVITTIKSLALMACSSCVKWSWSGM